MAAYPLSMGPAFYLSRRGWTDGDATVAIYRPVMRAFGGWGEAVGLWAYVNWWIDLADRHAGHWY